MISNTTRHSHRVLAYHQTAHHTFTLSHQPRCPSSFTCCDPGVECERSDDCCPPFLNLPYLLFNLFTPQLLHSHVRSCCVVYALFKNNRFMCCVLPFFTRSCFSRVSLLCSLSLSLSLSLFSSSGWHPSFVQHSVVFIIHVLECFWITYCFTTFESILTDCVWRLVCMGLVCIMWWYPKFNGSHFGLPPSSIQRQRMTGLGGKLVWTVTRLHRSQFCLSSRIRYAVSVMRRCTVHREGMGEVGVVHLPAS